MGDVTVLTAAPTESFPGLTRNKGQPATASATSHAAGLCQGPLAERLRLTVRAQESCGRGRCLVGGADAGFRAGRVVGAQPTPPETQCLCGPGQDDSMARGRGFLRLLLVGEGCGSRGARSTSSCPYHAWSSHHGHWLPCGSLPVECGEKQVGRRCQAPGSFICPVRSTEWERACSGCSAMRQMCGVCHGKTRAT